MRNIFWPAYLNLEHELIDIARTIHIDDHQLDVYSMRICDLIVRTVIEVEAISKELFFANGGTLPEEQQFPYFDTDCLKLLVDKWSIDKREVLVSSTAFDLQSDDNKILHPLHKSHKRGTSGADWCQAYQKVKHDRVNQLKEGKLKYFIRALAALYILNLYYRDDKYPMGTNSNGSALDLGFGSSVFSVSVHPVQPGVNVDGSYLKHDNYDQCIYLVENEPESRQNAIDKLTPVSNKLQETRLEMTRLQFVKEVNETGKLPEQERIKEIFENIKADEAIKDKVCRPHLLELTQALNNLKYQAVLNKQQY